MPGQKGTAVNFAFGSSAGLTISTPTLTGYLLQGAQHGLEADLATFRNGDGDVINETYYDQRGTAELRVLITGATIADARTNTTLDNFPPGTIVNITACAARPDLVESNWIVTEAGPRVEGENTGAAMIVIPLRRRAGITAAAT
jgi:hypothetical protein